MPAEGERPRADSLSPHSVLATQEAPLALGNSLQAGLQGPNRKMERWSLVKARCPFRESPVTETWGSACESFPRQGPHKFTETLVGGLWGCWPNGGTWAWPSHRVGLSQH